MQNKKRRNSRQTGFYNSKRGRSQHKRRHFSNKNNGIHPSLFVKKASEQVSTEYVVTHQFSDFAFSPLLKQCIAQRSNYVIPTPIQDQTIPLLLSGKDVIGIASTGTGKTAAFLLPLIEKVLQNKLERVLIIAPTRELAFQINEEFRRFSSSLGIWSVVCIGGTSKRDQISKLRKNPNFVIGTPGRLLDLGNQPVLQFSKYSSIVLDEVDMMLDMGFVKDIEKIIAQLPQKRQSLFFSATLPDTMKGLVKSFLTDPTLVSVEDNKASTNVDQDVIRVGERAKIDVLHELLSNEDFKKVLVFGKTKWGVEKLAGTLEKRGLKVASIHGNKNQNQRRRALESFKSDQIQTLLATDVASRGLDIQNVTHVINFDLPESYETYIHRIGRTGRANKKGTALTFI